MSSSITVLIIDDHTVVRQGVRALLGAQEDIEVVGEASSGEQALELTRGRGGLHGFESHPGRHTLAPPGLRKHFQWVVDHLPCTLRRLQEASVHKMINDLAY
jgi:CheY-like chemotaxis protein